MSFIYEKIKEQLSMKDVLSRYGFEVNRAGFISCPFHDEKTASMKIYEKSFYCFGCGAGGDVIKFTALLFGLTNSQAALRLNEDFGLVYISGKAPARAEYQKRREQQEREKQKFRKDYLSGCERFRSLNKELETAEGFRRAEIMSELEYLEYYFDNTDWR